MFWQLSITFRQHVQFELLPHLFICLFTNQIRLLSRPVHQIYVQLLCNPVVQAVIVYNQFLSHLFQIDYLLLTCCAWVTAFKKIAPWVTAIFHQLTTFCISGLRRIQLLLSFLDRIITLDIPWVANVETSLSFTNVMHMTIVLNPSKPVFEGDLQ